MNDSVFGDNMNYEDLHNIKQMLDDFAVLTVLKRGRYGQHEVAIYSGALQRVQQHGVAILEKEIADREYARLKQAVLDFEANHPQVKG